MSKFLIFSITMLTVSLRSVGAEPAATRVNLPPSVTLLRVPNGGIQPQVATDESGTAHLVYFTGDALHGDLLYVHTTDGGVTFSSPIRVNSQPGSAIAVGNIRGARIAIGRDRTVHVAWNGSGIAEPRSADGQAPMLYSHLNAKERAFEPQRNLITTAFGIDGGGAIAADREGNVYVFWHATAGANDEAGRQVWLARSGDDGKTFAHERVAFDRPTGVCGCCGMNAFADSHGSVFALFRSASELVHRDMYLITSDDRGRTFHGADISKWNVGYCVMSSEAFAESASDVLAAWETEKQIFYGHVTKSGVSTLVAAPGTGVNRKYPALAANKQGFFLLAWTESMGWKKGGSVVWQVFDPSGKVTGEVAHADGVPAWDLVAAFTAPDGSFRIVF